MWSIRTSRWTFPSWCGKKSARQAFQAIKANTIKGAETRVPQLVPPGTTEFGVGITEGLLDDLPSKDFFMTTLYRQHYPGEDEDGYPPWMQEHKRHPEGGTSPKKKPPQPGSSSRPSRSSRSVTRRRADAKP